MGYGQDFFKSLEALILDIVFGANKKNNFLRIDGVIEPIADTSALICLIRFQVLDSKVSHGSSNSVDMRSAATSSYIIFFNFYATWCTRRCPRVRMELLT